MKRKYIIWSLFVAVVMTSCTSTRSVSSSTSTTSKSNKTKKSKPLTKEELRDKQIYAESEVYFKKFKKNNSRLNQYTLAYIEKYKDIAVEKMIQYNIPASITLAQGILESGNGRSELTRKANNHFGIKCHKGWKGKKVYHDDDKRNECFRKYDNPVGSFNDHSLFLTSRSRYASLFDLREDNYKAWARGLKKAGYATDRKYPHKLIGLIEDYHLHGYDKIVLKAKKGKWYVEEIKEEELQEINNNKNYIIVNQGDTLYSIAKNNNITVADLKKLNNLSSNEIQIDQKLYVK